MAQTLHAPATQPGSRSSGWIVLFLGTIGAFVVGAIVQILVFVAFGLCTEANQAACAPGTVPTAWEWALATVPTYLLWVAPSVVSAVLGYRSMRDDVHGGRTLMIAAIVLAIAITVGATSMWWL